MGAARRNIAHRPAWPSLALTALVALSGCGLTAVEDARDEARSVARDAATARPAAPDPGYVTVRRVDRPYVGLKPVEEDRRGTLPERFLAEDAVTLPLADARDEAVIAARIEAATGLACNSSVPRRGMSARPSQHRDGLSPNGGIWTGPLDRLLDAWTEAAGHDWRYDARVVLAATDRDTAEWSAESLGRAEVESLSEGVSYDTPRDGVTLSARRDLRSLVLPAEVARLENLSGYVKFVSRLLGHSDVRSTLRYAHLGDREIEAAAERVGQSIAAVMGL